MKPQVDLDAKISARKGLGNASQGLGAYAGLIFVTLLFAGGWLVGMKHQSKANTARQHFLTALKTALAEQGIESEVVADEGVLRLATHNVLFPIGVDAVPDTQLKSVDTIAAVLDKALTCVAKPAAAPAVPVQNVLIEEIAPACTTSEETTAASFSCQESFKTLSLDSVLVQGHADMRPVKNQAHYKDNLELSSLRSQFLLRRLYGCTPALKQQLNAEGLPLLNTAAYATQRPVHRTDGLADENRRMELRFLVRGL